MVLRPAPADRPLAGAPASGPVGLVVCGLPSLFPFFHSPSTDASRCAARGLVWLAGPFLVLSNLIPLCRAWPSCPARKSLCLCVSVCVRVCVLRERGFRAHSIFVWLFSHTLPAANSPFFNLRPLPPPSTLSTTPPTRRRLRCWFAKAVPFNHRHRPSIREPPHPSTIAPRGISRSISAKKNLLASFESSPTLSHFPYNEVPSEPAALFLCTRYLPT